MEANIRHYSEEQIELEWRQKNISIQRLIDVEFALLKEKRNNIVFHNPEQVISTLFRLLTLCELLYKHQLDMFWRSLSYVNLRQQRIEELKAIFMCQIELNAWLWQLRASL
jgi:hypothetical protein